MSNIASYYLQQIESGSARVVGKGGMGCVYKVTGADGNAVALKMMTNKVACYDEYRKLFNIEASMLKKLHHPDIVKIVGDTFTDSAGNYYLPMEFVEGETLQSIIKRDGPFSEEKARAVMLKILAAIQYIHQGGCIHRDIKPANIMLRPNGGICIIDFGIAKDANISTGMTVGRIIGTDGYMSPEQAKGDNIDHRTDIYSLGCLLFYMLTGKDAIAKSSNNYATVIKILEDQIPHLSTINSSLSNDIDNIVQCATNKNMTLRYQTATHMERALKGDTVNIHKDPLTNRQNVHYNPNGEACITIGKAQDNDFIVDNQYVSRHHATITVEPSEHGADDDYILTYTDHSTNGTGINGRLVRNESYPISYKLGGSPVDIMLSGRPENTLDWGELYRVMQMKGLFERRGSGGNGGNGGSYDAGDTVVQTSEEKLSLIWYPIILLFPIVGVILALIYKNDSPQKSKAAGKWALISFVLGYILYLFMQNFG